MRFDVLLPIQSANTSRDREEIFLISFDGFIKNISEGIVRTMLRDYDDYIHTYPGMVEYDGMSTQELYDETMLIPPHIFLKELSNHNRTDEEIMFDMDDIESRVILENSRITQFEYSLYQLLQEDKIQKCYIYKENAFFENEVQYLIDQFHAVMNKIEIISHKSLPDIYDEAKPTTIFLTDPAFLFDYIENHYSPEDITDKMFIILNSIETVYLTEYRELAYTELFQTSMNSINDEKPYGVAPMYNFALEESVSSLSEYQPDEEEEDYDEFE